mmetsp:Transcript_17217/g.23672  ORF Transcript_17217/g.23672 Transcript_17217/m.23672 type:complete len:119 (-) Transcript_17217:285-641(-)|eukprot:CAMPEP_0185734954 /NCGR_PEP_ID=MMETSP1171-20130828/23996_1 /TAXON_ID=374046 /ORGANISM="Helicotheca tamensis, Strain CCMP826" /LENGTH=118 /DNA_ID=CAMNT_0028405105 /DNA_START=15 /DNA_END=371 /DNA_ORIENTATION=-
MTKEDETRNPTPANSEPESTAKREIEVATALMSIWGPCRGVGDAYLACVATSGLGMCKSIRYGFQQCAQASMQSSTDSLTALGSHMCSHVPEGSEERARCAAQIVFAQQAASQQQQNE